MPLVSAAHAWEVVLNRDRRGDGRFVYAVSSTRVYCRPSCPSRRPTRNHVTFFDSPQLAELAGYRACLRCRPQSVAGSEAIAMHARLGPDAQIRRHGRQWRHQRPLACKPG